MDIMNLMNFSKREKVLMPETTFARKVVEAYPFEFVGSIVYGPRRVGKSVYALKEMMQIFMALGCTKEEAWRYSMDSLFFEIDDFLKLTRALGDQDIVWPILGLDDAGHAAGSQKWFTKRKDVLALASVFDTIATTTSGLILTTPNFDRIVGFIKDAEDFYRVRITDEGSEDKPWNRIASGYKLRVLPSGQIRIYSKSEEDANFKDTFSARLNDEPYEEYRQKRRMYTAKAAAEALEMIKETKKKGRAGMWRTVAPETLVDLHERLEEELQELGITPTRVKRPSV